MRKYTKFIAGGALAVALMVPASAAFAATDQTAPVCTGDQRQEQVQQHLQDGTHDGQMAQHRNGQADATANGGAEHRSGPQDGSGPQADRPMDGTGNRWGTAS
jgi:hypothetical protein